MNPFEPNLFTHLENSRAKALPEGGLSTVIFCGVIKSEGDMQAALQVHRKIVENEVNQQESANVTGLLCGQGNTILHLIEGPSFSVLRILSELASSEHFYCSTEGGVAGAGAIQSGNVVYCVEDRPRRYFPEWYSCNMPEKKVQVEEITDENCKDIVFDLSTRLLTTGSGLTIDKLEDARFADKLPGKNLVVALATSACFFTLEAFVGLFCDPYHVELESEQTWPLERLVTY
jgi:hypothetical protein